jgi:Sap, sulfolipid-1-addressing protein
MWATLLLMAIAVSLEPVRIGLTVLMLNRPRPVHQLLAFLCGGFLMGMVVGVTALLVLGAVTPAADTLTVPKMQIGIGILALVAAGLVAANVGSRKARPPEPTPVDVEESSTGHVALAAPRVGVGARIRAVMQGNSLWVAGVSGLGIALPSVDYLAALAVIHASGVGQGTQVGALIAFNLVAFALVEIPLLSYLVAPQRTLVWMTRVHAWIRSRTRRDVSIILIAAGSLFIAIGLLGL